MFHAIGNVSADLAQLDHPARSAGAIILGAARAAHAARVQIERAKAAAQAAERRIRLTTDARRAVAELILGRPLGLGEPLPFVAARAAVAIDAMDDVLIDGHRQGEIVALVTVDTLVFAYQISHGQTYWAVRVLLPAPDCGLLHASHELHELADIAAFEQEISRNGCPSGDLVGSAGMETCGGLPPSTAATADDELIAAVAAVHEAEAGGAS